MTEFDKGAYAMRDHIALMVRLAGHADLYAAIMGTELPTEPDKIAAIKTVRELLAMDDARPVEGEPQ